MPFNGSGIYTPIAAPDFPAVPLTTIRAAQYNNQINDMATALSQCLTRNGEGPALANIPMGGFQLTGLGAPSATGQALVYGQDANVANLAIDGSGKRITGDFSNATVVSRALFQTSTANGASIIPVIPNGTSNSAGFMALPYSTITDNASPYGMLACTTAEVKIAADQLSGGGGYLPMTFYTGGAERLRIDTSGNTLVKGIGELQFYASTYGIRANDGLEVKAGDFIRFLIGASEKFRVGTAGQLGIGGANYGTAGDVLTSGGPGAAPSWSSPASGLGVAQTWQNFTGSRLVGTTYTNSTGKAIAVSVYGTVSAGSGYATITVGGLLVGFTQVSAATLNVTMHAIVPAGATYTLGQGGGIFTPTVWAELRA